LTDIHGGLQRALRDPRAGLFDVLLVYRSIRGLLDIVDILNDAGVALVSASEHFDTQTPVGRMVMQILAVFAEFERAIIIDRVIGGMERKAAKGGWTVGPPPFGYDLEVGSDGKKTGFLVPNKHAPLVRVIFDLYRRKSLGARAIANWLNDQGHRTRNGRRWSHVAVLTVLRNRVYLGEIFFRGTWYPAPHQPLIGRNVFDQVQGLLIERGDDHAGHAADASDYDLAGLIRCHHCQQRYLGNAAHGRSARYRYYTCYTRQRFGHSACPADRLPADRLEAAIVRALLETYQHTDLFDQAAAQAAASRSAHLDRYRGELTSVRTKLRDAQQAIDRYLAAFERGTMPEDMCGPRLTELRVQQAQLKTRDENSADCWQSTPHVPRVAPCWRSSAATSTKG
jgi:site-specific DNA recombinase